MRNIVAINQGQRPLTRELAAPAAIAPADARIGLDRGWVAIDLRSAADFGEAHIPGALNIPVASNAFEQNVGWLLASESKVLLVVGRDAEANRAVHKLAFVGLDTSVFGFTAFEAWVDADLPSAGVDQLTVDQARQAIEQRGWAVLDVRETAEWDAGHIASATHSSFKLLPERLRELKLDPEKELAVVCGGGLRSSIACSILLRHGFSHVHNVIGGMRDWNDAGFPTVR